MILNKAELAIIQDKRFFDLKKSALQKIDNELVALRQDIKNQIKNNNFNLPENIDISFGKISKGENYKGLPYRILDFPRLFKQDGIFAYRIMFWWSKGFFFTFHLSGKYLDWYLIQLENQFINWQEQGVFYYNHNDEWQHEVEMPYYFAIEDIDFNILKDLAKEHGFLKFAKKLEIHQVNNLKTMGYETFKLFFKQGLKKS